MLSYAWRGDIAACRDAGSVDTVRENLEGAKYTLATNAKNAAAGLTHFADIAKFRNELDAKIMALSRAMTATGFESGLVIVVLAMLLD